MRDGKGAILAIQHIEGKESVHQDCHLALFDPYFLGHFVRRDRHARGQV
jgi:hypothetical protein